MSNAQQSIPFLVIAGSVDCFGFLSNALIFTYLFFNRVGSKLTTTLMKNQLAFDALISGFALCSLLVNNKLFENLGPFSVLFCRLWVSRTIFWFLVLLSEINLLCISVDRIRAVAFSASYRQHGKITLISYYAAIFIYSSVFALPSIFTVTHIGSACKHRLVMVSDNTLDVYMFVYSYLWLFTGYLIPVTVMAGCYVTIVILMRKIILKSLKNSGEPSVSTGERNTDAFSSGPTKLSRFSRSFIVTAIVMWSVFLVTHAYYTIFAILCTHSVIDFDPESVTRRVGIFTTVLNSAVNPLIMVLSSPPFRHGLWRFLQSFTAAVTITTRTDVTSEDRTSRKCASAPKQNLPSSHIGSRSAE
ncbi:hypothetical protein FBUS_07760 [Fasciolopsis buskii]|uniref:G-protein coupled receptors family 1 profile domain-containing protein n=1 Tax=Fasciolopsis buskii TaxID=27845 RepID=A0A8E0VGK9_9TREM|nr:hypothetical protein FBUS_07760 [Fasciolopsis buski]